jgi:two-component system, chemotaxis family, CheB/CheR fusion protein
MDTSKPKKNNESKHENEIEVQDEGEGKNTKSVADTSLYYVGIGASAGGLEALRPFVANLPESANLTYIVAQHMSPDHRSMMVELLARATKLKVQPVKHNQAPKANTIHVVPANTDVTISGGKLRLSTPSNTIGPKPSINRLFISLADDCEEKSIGIVLSGTGSDGAHGIKAIKAAGGITIAQDPHSAKYDSMPVAAIRIGGADLVLPSAEAGAQLTSLISRISATINNDQDELPPSTMRGIIRQITTHTGMDFTNYKEATLSRQIMRRMMAKQIPDIEEYGIYLKNNVQELKELASNFLICVTSFFRNPEAFNAVRKELQKVIAKKQPGDNIRIWIPACATGEEVYSIAIFLMEDLANRMRDFRIQIFATDMNTDAIHTARAGVYPATALANVNDELIKKYFSVQNGVYVVNNKLKEIVLFARQDITQDPPFVRLDLVCCRNLLIYFKPELQEKVMKIFHYSLQDNGLLFLGNSESIGRSAALFSEADRKNKIYYKRNTISPLLGSFGRGRGMLSTFGTGFKAKEAAVEASPHTNGVEQLFNIYAPPSVLITHDGEILEIFGDCSGFLSIRKGKANFNLFTLIAQTFRSELRAFVHRVARSHKSAYSMPAKLTIAGNEGLYRLATHYASDQNKADSDLLIVSFEKINEPESKSLHDSQQLPADELAAQRIQELEQELMLNRENLQTVIEELETANEELQSLNEEAQAGNEELQASNEELETANEELQASNEELTTINDELSARTLELSQSNNDITNVLSSLFKALLVIDTKLMVTRFNEKALEFFDIPSDLPANLATLATRVDMPDLLKHVQKVLKSGGLAQYEFENKQDRRSYLMRLSPYINKLANEKKITGVVISIADDTENKEKEEKLRLAASVFEHSVEATMITDDSNIIIAVNPAFTRITGYTEEEVIGKTPNILNSGKQTEDFFQVMWQKILTTGSWKGEIQNKRKNGEIYTENLSINVMRDSKGKITRHIAVFNDNTEAQKALKVIEHQASYDSLTGLPNRNLIQDRIDQQLLRSRRSGAFFAVMFLDLDDFKSINDSLGHTAGDQLIVKVGERLSGLLRQEDTVGRLGGDEFIILVNNFTNSDDIIGVANKILTEIRKPINIADHTIHTAVSIGITVYPTDGDTTHSLMKNADTAMYESKQKGRNTYSFFTNKMQDRANRRQWVMSELAVAPQNNQLQLHYQPIIDLKTMKIIAAEALIRWNHPQKGVIPPEQFIPIAEKAGKITELAEWVVSTGLQHAQTFKEKFGDDFHTAINLSMAQFVSYSHMKWLVEQLNFAKVNITIELTESLKLIDNPEYKTMLNSIKQTGCQLALDDFGTGQSSLSYIKQIPVDIVKIDQSFVRDIATDPADSALILAILQMAKAFNITTVAEGIETREQLAFLKQNGCHSGQGFLFSKALPFEKFQEFVHNFDGELLPDLVH